MPPLYHKIINNCIDFAFLTLLFFLVNFLLCTAALTVGAILQPWIFPASMLSVVVYGLVRKKTLIVLLFFGIFIVSLLLGYFTFDTTFDSISYHKPTIQALASNWNPIYSHRNDLGLWTLHYARGLELQASSIVTSGLGLETSKGINFMFFFATSALAFVALKKSFMMLSLRQIFIVVFVLMSNPVVLSQLFTFYNDAYLYMETISMIALFIIWRKDCENRGIYDIMLLSVTIIAVNTKFTHLFFGCLLWGGYWLYLWCFKDYKLLKRSFLVGGCALLVGIGFIGFNPYITNFINSGDPFYPLLSNTVDIMSGNTPEIFINDNRILAFVKAQLSSETQAWSILTTNITLEDVLKPSADSRTLGFGLLFAPLLICSITLMMMTRPGKELWIAFSLSLVPLCFFEQSWWARYIPFPWIIIAISIISYFKSKKNRKCQTLFVLTIIMVVMTVSITLVRNAGRRFHAHFHPEVIESLSHSSDYIETAN